MSNYYQLLKGYFWYLSQAHHQWRQQNTSSLWQYAKRSWVWYCSECICQTEDKMRTKDEDGENCMLYFLSIPFIYFPFIHLRVKLKDVETVIISWFVLAKYYLGTQTEKNEMGGICVMYEGAQKHQGLHGETCKKEVSFIKCMTAQLTEELLASQGLHSKEMHDSQHLQFQWNSHIYISNKYFQT